MDAWTIAVAVGGALVSLGSAIGAGMRRPEAGPRETIQPSAPTHAGSLLDADLSALRGRVMALEASELRAASKRDEMSTTLTRIETKLDERTSRKREASGGRESA